MKKVKILIGLPFFFIVSLLAIIGYAFIIMAILLAWVTARIFNDKEMMKSAMFYFKNMFRFKEDEL